MPREIFEDLFVLEMANNHWGSIERGKKIIYDFSQVVRFNNVWAAIKFQFRDVDSFIHKDFINRSDIRYIKKTLDTKMRKDDYATLVQFARKNNFIPMATPFDEFSVDLCVELGIQIIKVASSDINDWVLLEKIASTKKPVIVSTGGSSLKDMDDLVTFFTNRNIPLAMNYCVSIYPSEDSELEMNQIDFLKNCYPNIPIGFSTHEYHDWSASIMIAYAKGVGYLNAMLILIWITFQYLHIVHYLNKSINGLKHGQKLKRCAVLLELKRDLCQKRKSNI